MQTAYERDYSHLTVIASDTRALLGYLSIPRLKEQLKSGPVQDEDLVEEALQRFRRKGKKYKVITIDTPLEELEELEEFVRRRPPASESWQSYCGGFSIGDDILQSFGLPKGCQPATIQYIVL